MNGVMTELEDGLAYVGDILEVAVPRLRAEVSRKFWDGFVEPCIVAPLLHVQARLPTAGLPTAGIEFQQAQTPSRGRHDIHGIQQWCAKQCRCCAVITNAPEAFPLCLFLLKCQPRVQAGDAGASASTAPAAANQPRVRAVAALYAVERVFVQLRAPSMLEAVACALLGGAAAVPGTPPPGALRPSQASAGRFSDFGGASIAEDEGSELWMPSGDDSERLEGPPRPPSVEPGAGARLSGRARAGSGASADGDGDGGAAPSGARASRDAATRSSTACARPTPPSAPPRCASSSPPSARGCPSRWRAPWALRSPTPRPPPPPPAAAARAARRRRAASSRRRATSPAQRRR